MATKRASSGKGSKKSAKKSAKKTTAKSILPRPPRRPFPDPLCFERCAEEFALCLSSGRPRRECLRAFRACVAACMGG